MLNGFFTPDERRIAALSRARASWREVGANAVQLSATVPSEQFFGDAVKRLAGGRHPLQANHHSVLIVAKSPHAGSPDSIVDIVARCLAFGLQVVDVTTLPAADASDVAHALYPDVWINYARPPAGDRVWLRLAKLFDRPEFVSIFGVPYRTSMVKEGHRVVEDNELSTADFAAIWELGRFPLGRADAARSYGEEAVAVMFGAADDYEWYRGPLPIGIQKVASSFMAFALRHDRVYGGAPTIVLNGQFALLSRLFEYSDHGAVVVELGLPEGRSVTDFRRLLVGHSDVPGECRLGSIRRDAADGFFVLDNPERPVTPWANVVHASDGLLSGAIETDRLIARAEKSWLYRELLDSGYTGLELDEVIFADPVVISSDRELRLTRLTKGKSAEACVSDIVRHFPSRSSLHGVEGAEPLRALLDLSCSPDPAARLERPVLSEGDAAPRPIARRADLLGANESAGEAALARGAVGVLVPLAGSGGRFGGYDLPEGAVERIKPLLPLFSVHGTSVSALDVRAAHLRTLRTRFGASIPAFLSCNHHTELLVSDWARSNSDLDITIGRVPEFYRVRARAEHEGGYEDCWEALSNLVRAPNGLPVLKPLGSMGLLWALLTSGTLSRWIDDGVEYVVAANSDDVGFRVDPGIIGMLEEAGDEAAAIIVATSVPDDPLGVVKGGAIRDRVTELGTLSRYVLENASIQALQHLNTNQLYFRSGELFAALKSLQTGQINPLPFYAEAKQARVGEDEAVAWHVYQPCCDILRVMKNVDAIEISSTPDTRQVGAFSPLKRPDDVSRAQATIDRLVELGDVLTLQEEQE